MLDSKRVLNCLPKKTLLELSQAYGYKGWIVLNKGEIVDRLSGDRSITLEDLLTTLKIPSLKSICRDLGLDAKGSKGDLAGRILGVGNLAKPAPKKKTSTTRKEAVAKTEADTQRSKQNRKRSVAIKKSELYCIFMIDASAGFMKDGPKNRLRSQDNPIPQAEFVPDFEGGAPFTQATYFFIDSF